jgi:hypothetical protein
MRSAAASSILLLPIVDFLGMRIVSVRVKKKKKKKRGQP